MHDAHHARPALALPTTQRLDGASDRRAVAPAAALAAAVLLGLGVAGAGPVAAAQGDSPAVLEVAASAGPTVVTIVVTTNASTVSSAQGDAGQVQGSGSGVIITPDGLILTNRHVAGDATSVSVILADGRTFDGETVGVDTLTDLAFVKIRARGLPTAALGDSSDLRVGQLAIAMGNPLGELPGSVSSGIVSGLDRTITVSDASGQGATVLRHLIQTDAAINPGNSGGPLLDGDGKVIGINTAEAGSATGIGFALPIDLARPIVRQVKAGRPIERPWIGVQYQDVNAQVALDNGLDVKAGAWVRADPQSGSRAVVARSPAARAGLKAGDIITALDGQAVDAQHQLDLLLLRHAPGDTVALTVLRGGRTIELDVVLGTRPDMEV